MSKKINKKFKEGIITVSVPFVKRRTLKGGVEYEGKGVRTYRVPLQVFHDMFKNELAKYPYEDELNSETFSSTSVDKYDTPYHKLTSDLCFGEEIFKILGLLKE